MRALLLSIGCFVLVIAAACEDASSLPMTSTPGPLDAPSGSTVEAPLPTFVGNRAPVEGTIGMPGATPATAQLTDVRTADHGTFDRIVFEFDGASPAYRVEFVPQATDCTTGEPAFVAGTAYLQVKFTSAQAHDDQGGLTFGRTDLILDLPALKNAAQTCDFEGDVTWVLGLAGAADFAVTPVAERIRLAVDVSHTIDPQTPIGGGGQ